MVDNNSADFLDHVKFKNTFCNLTIRMLKTVLF